MSKQDTDTLYETEGRWKPAALVVVVACHCLAFWMMSLSDHVLPLVPWTLLGLPSVLLTSSNIICLVTNGPAIGEMPVAAMALGPAALSAMLASEPGSLVWWAFLLLAVPCLVVCDVFLLWAIRLMRAASKTSDVEGDAVIIVLGGLVRNGQPVPTVRERLRVAAELWRESPKRLLLLTGGPTPDGASTEAQVMASCLKLEEGVPQEALLLEPNAINTQQNLRNARQLIDQKGLTGRQICVVSSDYHLYRALALARNEGIEALGIPAPVPFRSRLQQWCREVLVILVKGVR